jgi:hypothetical protein
MTRCEEPHSILLHHIACSPQGQSFFLNITSETPTDFRIAEEPIASNSFATEASIGRKPLNSNNFGPASYTG